MRTLPSLLLLLPLLPLTSSHAPLTPLSLPVRFSNTTTVTLPPGNCPNRKESYCCAEVYEYDNPIAVRRLQPVNLTPKRAGRKWGGGLGWKCITPPHVGHCPLTNPLPQCCKHHDFQGIAFLGCRPVSEAIFEASSATPKRVAEDAQMRGEREMGKNEKSPSLGRDEGATGGEKKTKEGGGDGKGKGGIKIQGGSGGARDAETVRRAKEILKGGPAKAVAEAKDEEQGKEKTNPGNGQKKKNSGEGKRKGVAKGKTSKAKKAGRTAGVKGEKTGLKGEKGEVKKEGVVVVGKGKKQEQGV
ncbi:hypothetical protein EX30DRAFT_367267 [Ascodesmis nigricans]|uniref:Hydrophobin n=1 Tax=Ascodesmis nigricans TaxID=341454 RepID=A0A4S2MIS1_9PEZI|nr:hypothetical protein EX30DRAFT_367267 [Ascodesmis nigricans]